MKHKAFTLVELLVVVSIIALLIAILLPSLKNARRQGKKAVTLANLRSIGIAVETYGHDNRFIYPTLADEKGKAFRHLSLLGRDHKFPPKLFINPNTKDSPANNKTFDARLVLADFLGKEITDDDTVSTANIGQVGWHCSFSYDSDVKHSRLRKMRVYMGDRADYENGKTVSNNWRGRGMCLLWTDQHAEFRKQKSLPNQSDPNLYHHNEYDGEGADEVVDGVSVKKKTLDTHLRFFSEEEDDELLPD